MSNKPKPTHIAYTVPEAKEGSDKKSDWTKVGAVWPHKDGKGFDIVITAANISVRDRIVCRERKDDDTE